MKKIFFLCAAAALFAACSSDEVGEIEGVNEVVPSVEREYPSAASVEFTNGTAMIIGAFDENGQALTRANEGTVEFCIDLGKLESDVLNNLGDYKLKADDFAIRIDGEYLESIKVEGNTAAIVELNSETDFVAASDPFKDALKSIASLLVENIRASAPSSSTCGISFLIFSNMFSYLILLTDISSSRPYFLMLSTYPVSLSTILEIVV